MPCIDFKGMYNVYELLGMSSRLDRQFKNHILKIQIIFLICVIYLLIIYNIYIYCKYLYNDNNYLIQ